MFTRAGSGEHISQAGNITHVPCQESENAGLGGHISQARNMTHVPCQEFKNAGWGKQFL